LPGRGGLTDHTITHPSGVCDGTRLSHDPVVTTATHEQHKMGIVWRRSLHVGVARVLLLLLLLLRFCQVIASVDVSSQ